MSGQVATLAPDDLARRIGQDLGTLFPETPATWPPAIAPEAARDRGGAAPYLNWLAHHLRPRRVVQLGLGDGATYFGLCQTLQAQAPEVTALGVPGPGDPWPLPLSVLRHNITRYGDLSHLIEADAATLASFARPGGIDLLIVQSRVDAALVDQLQKWVALLSGRGVVVFVEGAGPGIEPLIARSPVIPAGEGVFLTVLVGEKRTDLLSALAGELPLAVDRAFADLAVRLRKSVPAVAASAPIIPPRAVADQVQDRIMDIALLTDQYETELAAAGDKLGALQTQSAQEIAALTAEKRKLVSELSALKATLNTTKQGHAIRVSSLKADLADSQRKRAGHWRNLEAARAALAKETRKTKDLRNALTEEKARVQALLDSTSWKITRPIRALLSLVRR